ncbi:alpha/beta hydrolase [Glutamicibacter ectropisis]|uniref:Alpha/beta hydrolase n=1 Tax=Glutamicibacter ectropisis TaxID=3046593 RepID=A0AAU6WA59_9MICC
MNLTRGSGLPLLMIHGNGVDHRILLPLDTALGEKDVFERHYIDLPGFGDREPLSNAGGLPEIADWLENEIPSIVGERPFALLGNSMGGLLCQEMADRFAPAVRGMFLIAPVVYAVGEQRTLPRQSVSVRDQELLNSLSKRERELFTDVSVIQSRWAWEEFSRWVLPGLLSANLRAMAKLSKRYFLEPLPVHRKEQLMFPVTVVCGRNDHVTGFKDPEQLQSRYPNLNLKVIDDAGHNVHIEQQEIVERELRAWAKELAVCGSETS